MEELRASCRAQSVRPFSPHLARGLVVTQADKDGVTEQSVVSPGEIGDLGDKNGVEPNGRATARGDCRSASRAAAGWASGEVLTASGARRACNVASADGRAFLCDECEASAHVVMTEMPVPPPHGAAPVERKPVRIDWRKLRHTRRTGRSIAAREMKALGSTRQSPTCSRTE